MVAAPRRPPSHRPPRIPPRLRGPIDSLMPSFWELVSLFSPFAGAFGGWWFGDRLGGLWYGLLFGLLGTGLGAIIARRGAPEILP